MHILIIAEKRKQIQPYLEAFARKKHKADYLRISKITLVSKSGRTEIKALGEELHVYDAVFIQTRASLAPFIEPLLEELQKINCYTNVQKGSYYLAWNEPYQFVQMALSNIPSPRALTTASAKNIEQASKKISYPVMVKTFHGKKVQQSLIAATQKELCSFVKSIKTEIDAFLVKQFIEDDAVTCVVVGDKVFAVKRKHDSGSVEEIGDGQFYRPTDSEIETALAATKALGRDISRIDLAKGKVVKAEPLIPIEHFSKAHAGDIEDAIAEFLAEKAAEHENKTKTTYDLVGIKRLLSKTLFGKVFK